MLETHANAVNLKSVEKHTQPLAAGLVATAAALLLFGYLASAVRRDGTLWFDESVRNAVHAWASPRLTYAMRGLSWLGSPLFLVTLAIMLLWRLAAQGRRHAAVLLVLASAGAEALEQILKLVFRRVRPEAFFGYPEPLGYSFPSGHAVMACCFCGVVAVILTRQVPGRRPRPTRTAAIWAAAAFLALAIGASRVYLGVHYPSDVLAGYAAAVLWVLAVRAGYAVWLRRRSRVNQASNG